MQTTSIWAIVTLVFFVVAAAIYGLRSVRRGAASKSNLLAGGARNDLHDRSADETPTKISIGADPAQAVVTIEAIENRDEYEKAQPLDFSTGAVGRLSSLLQAAPSILVASEASGKRLMEVVVNGELTRAADGNGYRAFVSGPSGIKENARLFEVSNIQNAINAAAVWQIASVVVAQKHLADISRKLDEIKAGVSGISRFLDNQRKSRVQSTYEYLGQAYQAIKAGELPSSVRGQLEDCERDLLEIQVHLEQEFRQRLNKRVEHKEAMGTGDLAKDIVAKMDDLDELANDFSLCLKTRVAAWHVLSLFPGEPQFKHARRESIERAIELFCSMSASFSEKMSGEVASVKAFWNSASTLEERKARLSDRRALVLGQMTEKLRLGEETIARSEQLLLAHDRPTRMFFQFENNKLIGARQAA